MPLLCRFNWADEAVRAKQLVAAGELVLEEEEPFELTSDSSKFDDMCDTAAHEESCGTDGDKADKEGLTGGHAARRSTARPDKNSSSFQIKAASPAELGRLLP